MGDRIDITERLAISSLANAELIGAVVRRLLSREPIPMDYKYWTTTVQMLRSLGRTDEQIRYRLAQLIMLTEEYQATV